MNAGPVIHPPLILMNAAPLQHFERWDIHNEGTQPAVRARHRPRSMPSASRCARRWATARRTSRWPTTTTTTAGCTATRTSGSSKSGDWREHIDLHTHRYMHRGHRARPGLPGLGGALGRRRRADRARPAGDRRRASSAATCATGRARSRRWAWPACRATRSCRHCCTTGGLTTAALRRRRRRPHGARHRDRLRLCRPRASR